MERPAALIRARQSLTTFAAAAAILVAPAAPARAAWSSPVEIGAPSSLDVFGPQIAVSQAGAAALSFNQGNVDAQTTGTPLLALAAPGSGFGDPHPESPSVVLALAYSGRTLELLTATSRVGQQCCDTVRVIHRRPNGSFSRPQVLVTGVGGPTIGELVPLADGRVLAVVAGPQRLWVTEARGTGRFAPATGLTRPGLAPSALAVSGTPAGGSTVVWTQAPGQGVISASGRPGATPSRPRTVLTAATGHVIDGLQLVPSSGGLTLGWTESWNDTLGAYHSRAMAGDLLGPGTPIRPRALSAPADVASALALAADARGDQVAAWNVCASDVCALHSSVRSASGRWFGARSRRGRIDAGESADATMAPVGEALIGWITGTQVVLAEKRPKARGFGPARPLSGTFAANLDLACGPTGRAVAIWTQGTLNTAIYAALSP